MLTAREMGILARGGKVFSLAVTRKPAAVLLKEPGGGEAKSKMNEDIPLAARMLVYLLV